MISVEDRQVLLEAARSFNRQVKPKRIRLPESLLDIYGDIVEVAGDRPGDDFNARASWEDILCPHGWEIEHISGGVAYWRRPDKYDEGVSATTGHCGDKLHVFSTNASPFEAEATYSKFAAFALLNHEGDFRAAAEDLSQQGFGAAGIDRDLEQRVNQFYERINP